LGCNTYWTLLSLQRARETCSSQDTESEFFRVRFELISDIILIDSCSFEAWKELDAMLKMLKKLNSLENLTLVLYLFGITQDLVRISHSLETFKSLKTLDFWFDCSRYLNNAQIQYLASALKTQTDLRMIHLSLWDCDITNEGLVSISDTLKDLRSLKILHLNFGQYCEIKFSS